jgi:hypothetical protein
MLHFVQDQPKYVLPQVGLPLYASVLEGSKLISNDTSALGVSYVIVHEIYTITSRLFGFMIVLSETGMGLCGCLYLCNSVVVSSISGYITSVLASFGLFITERYNFRWCCNGDGVMYVFGYYLAVTRAFVYNVYPPVSVWFWSFIWSFCVGWFSHTLLHSILGCCCCCMTWFNALSTFLYH